MSFLFLAICSENSIDLTPFCSEEYLIFLLNFINFSICFWRTANLASQYALFNKQSEIALATEPQVGGTSALSASIAEAGKRWKALESAK